jgi:hypothetical protein
LRSGSAAPGSSNNVINWKTDLIQPYMFQTLGRSQVAYYQVLAGNNPNYNVEMVAGSIAWAR